MTRLQLKKILEDTGLRVTYRRWKAPPPLPYIVFLYKESEGFGADDIVYFQNDIYQIELYSDQKDDSQEMIIENLFNDYDIYYEKHEVYIETENLYQVVYLISV